MNRGKTVFLYNALRYQNGVFEVVTVPRHKCDTHILAKRQFTHIDRWTVSKNVAARYDIANVYDRTLVNTGVLIRTGVFGQVVDIYTCVTGLNFSIVNFDYDTASVNFINHTTMLGNHTHA